MNTEIRVHVKHYDYGWRAFVDIGNITTAGTFDNERAAFEWATEYARCQIDSRSVEPSA